VTWAAPDKVKKPDFPFLICRLSLEGQAELAGNEK
jgi:hypothetical protein